MTLRVDIAAQVSTFSVACDFKVDAGKAVALVGASGAGKTSVLRTIAGLLRPQGGSIVCDDDLWSDAARDVFIPPQQRNCAMVFPGYALFGHMSALENAAFGLRASGHAGSTVLTRAQTSLELAGAASLAGRKAGSLSSGEAQRVAIARALAMEPRVLLLDEPLSAIDVERRAPVRETLRRIIGQAGIAAVLVTHDPVEAMLFSESLVVMEAGRVVQRGTPDDLREHPRSSYVAAFAGVNLYRGVARPLDGDVSAVDVGGATLTVLGRLSGAVALVIDPDAVVLSRSRPESSARNALYGPVTQLVPDGASVRVNIASTPPIVARVTKRSVQELELAPGMPIHAIFKASEIRVH
jgi:molybdate transport system ATP-binding protein